MQRYNFTVTQPKNHSNFNLDYRKTEIVIRLFWLYGLKVVPLQSWGASLGLTNQTLIIMQKKKYYLVFGEIGSTGNYWLEYHSFVTERIYVNIVRNQDDIDLFTRLNLVKSSIKSYKHITKLMSVARQGAMNVHISNDTIVTELREKLCDYYFVIEYYSNVNTVD